MWSAACSEETTITQQSPAGQAGMPPKTGVDAAGRRRQLELVLVGGGHSHVQVLRALMMERPPHTHLTVVLDQPVAVYSGMVPGYVAGQYRAEELEIDVVPLARRAGARVILAAATGVEAAEKRILLAGRAPIRYDVASFDVGSTVAGLDLPGVRQWAIATRPIGRFVARVDEIVARAVASREREAPFRVVVVGAGAGGIELAFTLERRLCAAGVLRLEVTVVHAGAQILPGYSQRLVRAAERKAEERDLRWRLGRRVVSAGEATVTLDDGSALPCDALVWVTGAVAHPWMTTSGLPTEQRGFVRVRPTLQVEGYDDLFAVGDCATLAEHPRTAKAGVYAVRQGPYLTANLRARLVALREPAPAAASSLARLRRYRPQSDFLTLLNFGDGTAAGAKWGWAATGRWVMRLKDRIDRKFMRKFQVLATGGGLSEEFRKLPEMADEMLCGGCAAKVGQPLLERALGRLGPGPADDAVLLGLERPDDAAAIRLPRGDILGTTVDAFKAFTDDPHLVGRVAAVNALSDLHATGIEPRAALALVALPLALDDAAAEETLYQVLAGARAVFDAEGVSLLGGHTTTAEELLVGFAVHGLASGEDALLRAGSLAAGQILVLSKPLGTGVLMHADMKGMARGPWVAAAFDSMLRSNREAASVAWAVGAAACTDVTGFGLAGHLSEMLRASRSSGGASGGASGGVSAELDAASLPALPGALELLAHGERSTFHAENAKARHALAVAPELAGSPNVELLFDPQTSGGLILAVDPRRGGETVERLRQAGDRHAAVIGRVVERRDDGALIAVE
jgi:selenide,water dikinase